MPGGETPRNGVGWVRSGAYRHERKQGKQASSPRTSQSGEVGPVGVASVTATPRTNCPSRTCARKEEEKNQCLFTPHGFRMPRALKHWSSSGLSLIGQDGGEEAVSESLRCAEASRARHWPATGPPGSMELFTRLMLAVLPRQKSEIKDDEERQARHHAGIQPSSARMPHATLEGPPPRGR